MRTTLLLAALALLPAVVFAQDVDHLLATGVGAAIGALAVKLWRETENLVERLILVGGVSGFGLLFLGVLLDRLKAMKTDRYLEVQK